MSSNNGRMDGTLGGVVKRARTSTGGGTRLAKRHIRQPPGVLRREIPPNLEVRFVDIEQVTNKLEMALVTLQQQVAELRGMVLAQSDTHDSETSSSLSSSFVIDQRELQDGAVAETLLDGNGLGSAAALATEGRKGGEGGEGGEGGDGGEGSEGGEAGDKRTL